MGGTGDRVDLLPIRDPTALPGVGEEDELGTSELEEATARFEKFDVREARATKEADRQHILGVIEVAFGEVGVFNSLVRQLFTVDCIPVEVEPARTSSERRALDRARRRSSPEPVAGARPSFIKRDPSPTCASGELAV